MTLTVRPLNDALGAEVSGVDFSQPLSVEDKAALKGAFLRYQLLCLKAQPLTAEAFAAVARYFGEPQKQLIRKERVGEVPEVSILESTYKKPEDKPDDIRMVRLSGWHTDDSYFQVPAFGTLLQSIEIPDSGGQTRFSNTKRAYDDLPADTKARIKDLKAVHRYDTARAPVRPKKLTDEEQAETPDAIHPLVRTHEDTGEKSIYLNSNRTDHIVDMDRAESDELLDYLCGFITKPEYQYHHEWDVGDILVWDNRNLVHSVNMDFPVGQKRVHQRMLLKGARPV